MSGTLEGGLKARDKNLAKDPDFYSNIGKKSSEQYMQQPEWTRKPRGMAYLKLHDPERLKQISAVGGKRKKGYKKASQ